MVWRISDSLGKMVRDLEERRQPREIYCADLKEGRDAGRNTRCEGGARAMMEGCGEEGGWMGSWTS